MSFPTQEIPTRITLPEDLLAQPGCALTPWLHDCRLSSFDHTIGGYGPQSDHKKENNFQFLRKSSHTSDMFFGTFYKLLFYLC